MKNYSVFLILLTFFSGFVHSAEQVKLNRRSFLLGTGAAVVTQAVPRLPKEHNIFNVMQPSDVEFLNSMSNRITITGLDRIRRDLVQNFVSLVNQGHLSRDYQLSVLHRWNIPYLSPNVMQELRFSPEHRADIEKLTEIYNSLNLSVPKNIATGWNPVSFIGPQTNPIPGLVKVLRRSLFDAFRARVQQGEIESPKQAILAIEKIDEASCAPKIEPKPEEVPAVLVIEDEKE